MRLDALTGIRPFASLYVFLFHFGRPLFAGAPPWLRGLGESGFVAVSLFYVLSGFVLTTSQQRALASGRFDHGRFLARRLGRLVPAHLLMWLAMLPLALSPTLAVASGAFGDEPSRRALSGLAQLLLVQAWWPPLVASWNLPAWSISVELAFYLVLPSLIAALSALSTRRRWWALAALWAASLALTGLYAALSPDGAVDADRGAFYIDLVKYWPPARLPEFAFGVGLALQFERARATAGAARTAPRALGPLALVVIAVVLTQAERLPYAMLHDALLLPAFGALVWAVADARGAVARLFSARPLVRLGRATYNVYIVQMPLMYWVMVATHYGWIHWSGLGFVAAFLPLVVGTALLVHLVVEPRTQPLIERGLERLLTPAMRAVWAARPPLARGAGRRARAQ
jgi:peptidoglycan/LPS O-acetylase OafA/YrhL